MLVGPSDLSLSFFCSRWHFRTDGVLQISVEPIIRTQLRAVAGQVEHFDIVLLVGETSLDELAEMHPKVVDNEKHFLALALHVGVQRFEKLNELLRASSRSCRLPWLDWRP